MSSFMLNMIQGAAVERPPLWMMRQAGRILPEYRALRKEAGSFKNLVQHPEWAAEVTLQPVRRFDMDAAIIFSDILVIPECMGLDYEIVEKVGPRFMRTINNASDVDALKTGAKAAEDLNYVYQALRATRSGLDAKKALIGFAGAPWTIMAYMVQGGGSKNFEKSKALLYGEPETADALLEKITATTIAYLKKQIEAGAEVIQLFDSWANHVPSRLYIERIMPYIHRIIDAITEVPIILFAKGIHEQVWKALDSTSAEVLGVDWSWHPDVPRSYTAKILQGNLDPSVLLTNPAYVQHETQKMLTQFGRKHIANLGHGVLPMTPLENVYAFVETVQKHRYEG